MSTQFRRLTLAAGIALAVATASGTVIADTVSQDVTEARQETQIWTTYALSPYLRAGDLKVSVDNGKATLTGTVEDNVNKDLANEIALGVKGVTEVDNQILVKPDYAPQERAADPQAADRSYGEVVDDATITAAIKSKLLWNKHTEGLSTEVNTTLGKVTLKGTTGTQAGKDVAERLALNTRGVVAVNNQMVVKADAKPSVAATARSSATAVGKDISDAWITTKVKSTLMYSSNVDGSDITVDTNDGMVRLAGAVDSGSEQALAIELAENVRGVKSVDATGLTHITR